MALDGSEGNEFTHKFSKNLDEATKRHPFLLPEGKLRKLVQHGFHKAAALKFKFSDHFRCEPSISKKWDLIFSHALHEFMKFPCVKI